MTSPLGQELIAQCTRYFDECTERVERCVSELTTTQVWQRPNESSNSIGNLILHLQGNITQYVISSLGGRPDARQRDVEFNTRKSVGKETLLAGLKQTIAEAKEVMAELTDEQLLAKRSVQGFHYTGVANLVHVTEHYSYHVGQMVFWVKALKDMDMKFYDGIDLDTPNEP